MVSALSNPVALSFIFASKWLIKWMPWIAKNGSTEQLQALFQNPKVPHEVVDHALEGSNAFEALTPDRRGVILYHALRSKPVAAGPNDTSQDYDSSGHHTQDCVWNLFVTVDPADQGMANVLAEALPKLPGFNVPFQWRKSVHGDKKTDWKEDQVRFLQVLFDRWKLEDVGAEEKRYGIVPQHTILELLASRAPYYNEAAKQLVIDHPDMHVRAGYYRGLKNETLENLKGYYEKDGDVFCASAVYNPFFYERAEREIVLWFAERVRECKPPKDEYADSVGSVYVNVQEDLFKKSPGRYFELQFEAEYPIAYAASKLDAPDESGKEDRLEMAFLTKVAELSAATSDAVRSRNWLMVALAAAFGFIVAKL